jgi:hypothetical protein
LFNTKVSKKIKTTFGELGLKKDAGITQTPDPRKPSKIFPSTDSTLITKLGASEKNKPFFAKNKSANV